MKICDSGFTDDPGDTGLLMVPTVILSLELIWWGGGMAQSFVPGDDLIFQLESGFGLLRVLAVDGHGPQTVWHLLAYEDFYPNIEAAEEALGKPDLLTVRKAHFALTDRAFERTPAALLGNRAVTEQELLPYREWLNSEEKDVSDRSALLMLGIR